MVAVGAAYVAKNLHRRRRFPDEAKFWRECEKETKFTESEVLPLLKKRSSTERYE